MVLACNMLCTVANTTAARFPIKDQAHMPALQLSRTNFPFLSRAGATSALQWNHGPLYNALLSSSVLRISERGVSWCTTCDMQQSPQTHVLACLPTPDALCAVPPTPANSTIRLFPTSAVKVPADIRRLPAPDDVTVLGNLWAAAIDGCEGVHSRRTLIFAQKEYDVSLCDLVHGQLDFVFYPQDGQIAWSERDSANFFHSILGTALVIVCVLFLFTRVCANLSQIVRGRPRAFDWRSTTVTVFSAVYSVPAAAHNDFATEERVLATMLQAYALIYTGLLIGQHFRSNSATKYHLLLDNKEETNVNAVNTTGALVAVLLLLTAHLSNTFDSPFLNIFVLIFGARSFLKFLTFVLIHSSKPPSTACAKLAGLFFDTFAFASVLELGVRSSARSHNEFASTAAGLTIISALTGVFLFCLVERNTNYTKRPI